jgi:hypothetical protein
MTMNIRRMFLTGGLLLLLVSTALSVADARQLCVSALARCFDSCGEYYGGSSDFDGLQRQGCRVGCSIGYAWCVMNS